MYNIMTNDDKTKSLYDAVEKELQDSLKRNQIDIYLLGQRLFFHKDLQIQAEAWRELNRRIAEAESD
jgi:hypothetical protein